MKKAKPIVCRVDGCGVDVTSHQNARFCSAHLAKIPAPFARRWETTSDAKRLERLWEQIADDCYGEGGCQE